MQADLKNTKLDHILEANEFIKMVDQMAFYIKLNALNALFLAIRSGEQLKGYIVVTDEFNRFTSELMQFVELLRGEIHRIVNVTSQEMKQENILRLYRKINTKLDSSGSIAEFINNHEIRISDCENEIRIKLKTIQKLMLRNERLVAKGDMLAMQAKIEGAYSKSSRDVFLDVAENFQSHIRQVRDSLTKLKKMISSDILLSGKTE